MGIKESLKACGLRALLVISNGFLLGVGIVFAAIGGWLMAIAMGDNFDFKGADLPIGMIIVGGVLIAVAIIGFAVAKKESRILVIVYTVLLSIVILATIAVAGAAFFFAKSFQDSEYFTWRSTDESVVNELENQFECCGFDPKQAAQRHTEACKKYKVDCSTAISKVISNNFFICASVLIAFVVVEIISLMGALSYWKVLTAQNNKKSSKKSSSKSEKGSKKEKKKLLQKGKFDSL